MKKNNSPPVNLDQYLKGSGHRFCSYFEGARKYTLPYGTFRLLAIKAGAAFKLRKTALVDLDKLDAYIEANCLYEEITEGETDMPRGRKKIEDIDELIKSGQKKYVRYAEGAELYSMGRHTFEKLAKDANAVRWVKGIILVNIEKVNAFIESFDEEGGM